MLVLMVFAVLAGGGTAITPCVLPVLPALLSASAAGGRRRPLGIVLGLALTFTVAIVALAQLVKGVGLASGAARDVAVIVLIGFGALMLSPGLSARAQAPLSRLGRFGPKHRGQGFFSGMAVGGALGFVCAPCAGPILAAVTAVGASSGPTLQTTLVALSYSAGLSAVLLLWALGGRRVIEAIRRRTRGHTVERALGGVLLATGVLMAFNVDVRFEDVLAKAGVPAFLRDPTSGLENSQAAQRRLASLRPASGFALEQSRPNSGLPNLGPAPDFTDTQKWFNTPGGRPLTLAGLRGHVVLVDFWTYTCINCIRTLPFLKRLYSTYHRYGLEVIGVETPEFTFEQDAGNVAQAIRSEGIRYPVVQDNHYGTWNAYSNQYWPAEYLVDARGNVRHTHFGEGEYDQTAAAVRQLLAEAGASRLPIADPSAPLPSAQLGTPETYLDYRRAQGFAQPLLPGTHVYTGVTQPALNEFALRGRWNVSSEAATPLLHPGTITAGFQAARVYLVLTSAGGTPRPVHVQLDGRPIPAALAGGDVHGGRLLVSGQRLYSLVSLPAVEQHALTVVVPPGVRAYDFTFG